MDLALPVVPVVSGPAEAEAEAAKLMQQHSLAELGAIQASVREQVAAQAQTIRELVGAKHQTLLECADAIDSMKAAAAESADNVGGASRLCARIELMGEAIGERAGAGAAAAAVQTRTGVCTADGDVARQLAVVAATTFVDGALERAWSALDAGEPLRAAWVLISANALALEPSLVDALAAEQSLSGLGLAQLLAAATERTAFLRAELLAAAERLARAPGESARARAHALGTLVLLGGWSDADCLKCLLAGGEAAGAEALATRAASELSAAERLARRACALRDSILHAHRLFARRAEGGGAEQGGVDQLEHTLALFATPPAAPPLVCARVRCVLAGGEGEAGGLLAEEGEEEGEEGGQATLPPDVSPDSGAEVDSTGRVLTESRTPGLHPGTLDSGARALAAACSGLDGLAAARRIPSALNARVVRELSPEKLAQMANASAYPSPVPVS
ncbi:hypothetical protein T492DRAFT_1147181 [Pavlovales sp. CCMP2436]|nr:hypothetical protein T492DRAFT_1147181 [Pavlovales sp. CCMP2436]